ncbi:hypothetical protein ACWC3X_32615 [Streptomyces populi]
MRQATEMSSRREGVLKHISDSPVPGEGYADKKLRVRRQRFYGNIGHFSGLRGSWPTTHRSEIGSATLRK